METLLQFLTKLNSWIVEHKELTAVIGVPAVTFMVTFFLNRGVEKRAAAERQVERELARELKIADFRQHWISEIRADFSEVMALSTSGKKDESAIRNANARITNILLKMNPAEGPAQEVYDLLLQLINFKGKPEEKDDLALVAINAMNSFLKMEWERLKADLRATEEGVEQ